MENKSYLDKLDLKLNCHKQSDKSDFHRGALPLNFHCLYHLCCTTFLYPHLLFHFIACSKIALVPKLALYFHCLYHIACATFLVPHPLFRFIACSDTALVPKLPLFRNCTYSDTALVSKLPLFLNIPCPKTALVPKLSMLVRVRGVGGEHSIFKRTFYAS